MASVVVAAPPRQYQRTISNLGTHILKRVQKNMTRMTEATEKCFTVSAPQHITSLACQKKGWGELIQIENKEFSKSRVVAMLSQTRKGKCIIKKKKKKLWNLLHFGSTQRKTKEVKRQHCFARENETARGIERALTGISLSACPACPVLSIADQKNEGESSIKQKKSFTRRSCLS